MKSFIQSEISNGVATVTLCRAEKRNALNRELIEQLQQVIDQLKQDASLRIFKFAAEGSVFWCGDGSRPDCSSGRRLRMGVSSGWEDSKVYCQLLSNLFSLPVPTIVELQGPVLAGGVGLVLACDLLVASENVFFMLPEPVRGITAAIVTPMLVYRAGAGVASQLLLSGERITANRAWQVGLCHDVVQSDQLASRCDQLVSAILAGSKSAWAMTKQHLASCSNVDLLQQLENSIQVSASARETDDAREGLTAFLEKRKPAWQPE